MVAGDFGDGDENAAVGHGRECKRAVQKCESNAENGGAELERRRIRNLGLEI
jgi:hypothetical protein